MNNFELAVFYPNDRDEFITCQDYLDFRDIDEIDWLPELDDSTISLHIQGREWIATESNLGRLDWIVAQVELAAFRLRNNQPAVIRSAVIDQSSHLFLLESASWFGDANARISELLEPPRGGFGFPIPIFSNYDPSALYKMAMADREKLVNPKFDRIPFAEAELIHALERESDLGQRLLNLLGLPGLAPI